jgi:hypothetical protein
MNSTPLDLLPPETLGSVSAELPPQENAFDLLVRDHVMQLLLALALVVNLALFGYLALRFQVLPDNLPLHFDVAGLPDRIDAKSNIFALPIIGLVVLVINTLFGVLVHRNQRAATLLLAVSALLVQILMWFAVVNIIGGLI